MFEGAGEKIITYEWWTPRLHARGFGLLVFLFLHNFCTISQARFRCDSQKIDSADGLGSVFLWAV